LKILASKLDRGRISALQQAPKDALLYSAAAGTPRAWHQSRCPLQDYLRSRLLNQSSKIKPNPSLKVSSCTPLERNAFYKIEQWIVIQFSARCYISAVVCHGS